LIDRILHAKCDVVAVQEVYGRSKSEGAKSLSAFTEALSDAAREDFTSVVGDAEYDEIRNGFIIRVRAGRILKVESPAERNLPKLVPFGRSHRATRQPLGLALDVSETARHLVLVNIHFKSKVRGFKDPTGYEFEILRMESSEQARTFATGLARSLRAPAVTMILGDRNAPPESASDSILSGELALEDFQAGGGCVLDGPDRSDCRRKPLRVPDFVPLFPANQRGGSEKYRGREQWIDGIYLDRQYHLERGRKITTGVTGEFFVGSDHKLLWAELPL